MCDRGMNDLSRIRTMEDLPLDVVIPEQILDLKRVLEVVDDHASDSSRFSFIPDHVDSPVACARHQIQALLTKESYAEHDEDALDDGFFLCDLNVVYQKLMVWRRLFPRIKPFYAIKCNPDPMVAAILGSSTNTNSNGMVDGASASGFDCASIPEIELALRFVSSRDAVYANPQRAEHDLDTAMHEYNVRVLTFDGPEELQKIHRSYQQELNLAFSSPSSSTASAKIAIPQLVLRILVPDEHSSIPLGEKFGARPDRIPSLVQLAMELGLPIIGVSFHCGSGNHHPDAYVQAIRLAKTAIQLIDKIRQEHQYIFEMNGGGQSISPCWLLDIGGGYPGADGAGASLGRFSGKRLQPPSTTSAEGGDGQNKETASNIAKAVTPLIEELFPSSNMEEDQHPIHIIAEPGRYFVEEAFCLCSRIYRSRFDRELSNGVSVARRHYFIAQGVQGVFKDRLLCNETFTPTPLKMESVDGSSDDDTTTMIPSTVHGPSGEDYDVICPDILLPELIVGDWLVFDCMGAYTLSIAARSGRPTVRYVVGQG